VRIQGVGNLMTQLARCCKPVPHDQIVGYITRGRGVSIHRRDCPNALRLGASERNRMIDVSWSDESGQTYPVDVSVSAYDRQGLLRDVSTIVANEKVNVVAMTTVTDKHRQMATMSLTAEVKDLGQLSRLIDRLSQLPNVIDVHRQG
jgi:GTP pyrophosphokinase